MSRQAHLPDGTVLEFPDDAPDDVIDRTVKAHVANPKNNSINTGIEAGFRKPIDNAAELLSNIPVVGPAVDKLGQRFGLPSTADAVAYNTAGRSNNTRKGAQIAGNIMGTAPLAAFGGGPVVQGGLSGAALTDAKDPWNIAGDTLFGAASSKLVSSGLNKLGAVVSPQIDKGMRALNEMGVPMTLGQIASGGKGLFNRFVAGTEENLAKLPYVGDAINAARDRGTRGYYNGVLARTGVKVPENIPMGHESHSYIGGKLSSQYESILPKLRVEADDKLKTGFLELGSTIKRTLPEDRYKQFLGILDEAGLADTGGLNIDGRKLQHADRVLRFYSEKFGKSGDPNNQILGDAFGNLRQQFRSLNLRQNPEYAPQLQAINKAWRELSLIKKAAGDANKGEGVFTPAKYAQAARGSRTNQEVTRSADRFLPNRSPDSGTPRGLATSYLFMGGLPAAGASINPLAAIPALAAPTYTEAGQRALNKFVFAPRGPVAKAVGKGFRKGAELAPMLVPPLLLPQTK